MYIMLLWTTGYMCLCTPGSTVFLGRPLSSWVRHWIVRKDPFAETPFSCDPIGQLQVGNEPEIGNGRKMAGEMAGHFSGKARNGRANGRIAEIWPFSCLSGHLPAIFSGHFGPSPKNGRRHFSAIFDFGLISNL